MSPRALAVVAVLAVLAVGLAVVGQRQSAPTSGPSGGAALPGLTEELDAITRVTVVEAGGAPAVTLESGAGGWTVAERDDYRADVAKLRAALVALAEARIVELKTAEPSRHAAIGVGDIALESATGTIVRLETADGASRALILGDSDRADERYARRPDEPQSFLMDRDPDVPRDPTQWVEPRIVDVASARVRSVSIAHADGATLEIAKAEADERNFTVAGVPEGRELRNAGVANVTGNALSDLRLEDVARFDAATVDAPVATIRYATFDGLEVHVTAYRIGDENWLVLDAAAGDTAGDEVRAQAESIDARVGGWRYRIPSYLYEQMTRRLDDLLAPTE